MYSSGLEIGFYRVLLRHRNVQDVLGVYDSKSFLELRQS